MKKVLGIVFAMMLVVGVFAGCTDTSDTGSSSSSTTTETKESATEEASSEESTDGASEDKVMEVVFIPKLIGIPWFSQMEQGLKETAEEVGNMNITVSGPVEADPVQQAKALEDVLAKEPDCIIVVPNDTKVLEPILAKAREQGVLVITQEASTVENADLDVEFIITEEIGRQYGEMLAANMDGQGGFAIMVGGLTVESHNARADAALAYLAENYPDMYEVTSRVEGSESVEQSHDKTLELMKAYPDLNGILYIGSNGALGGATAVREKNLVGSFVIAGTSLPSQSKPYLEDGAMTANTISNPKNIGKSTAFIIDVLRKNNNDITAIGDLPVNGSTILEGKVILFHAPADVTFENADSFGF